MRDKHTHPWIIVFLILSLLFNLANLVLNVRAIMEDHAQTDLHKDVEYKAHFVGKTIGDHLEFDHGDSSRGLK